MNRRLQEILNQHGFGEKAQRAVEDGKTGFYYSSADTGYCYVLRVTPQAPVEAPEPKALNRWDFLEL